MIAWFSANALTILVAAIVLAVTSLCLRSLFPGKGKSGCAGCGGSCAGCGGSCTNCAGCCSDGKEQHPAQMSQKNAD